MLSLPVQGCNKEQNPAYLFPSDQEATTLPPCWWAPAGAEPLQEQLCSLAGRQQRTPVALILWDSKHCRGWELGSPGKEAGWCLCAKTEQERRRVKEMHGVTSEPWPRHLPVLRREGSGAQLSPKMNSVCSAGSISPFKKSWVLLKYSCVIKKRKCNHFISLGLWD